MVRHLIPKFTSLKGTKMNKIKNLSIIIPVYNELDTFNQIYNKVLDVDLRGIEKEIVIIDDSSTDGTTKLLKDLQQTNPANTKFIFKTVNEGKGFALRDGFKQVSGDYVIVQDADLEYYPEDYLVLIDALENSEETVIYGSRFMGNYEDMLGLHFLGNKLVTLVTNVLFGVMLTDMETCYKLLPGDFVRKVDISASRFDFEPEITAKILRAGIKIKEVPIRYTGRLHSEGKKLTWRDGLAAIATLFKYRFIK